jgi:hypothetical protein
MYDLGVAGTYAIARLNFGVPSDSLTMVGTLFAAFVAAWLLYVANLRIRYGRASRFRRRREDTGTQNIPVLMPMCAGWTVWFAISWLFERIIFPVPFDGFVDSLGVVIGGILGIFSYQWVRECRWERWRKMTEAARNSTDN